MTNLLCLLSIHDWGKWHYKKPTTCAVIRICARCKSEQFGGLEHQWSDWNHIVQKCEKSRICSHCQEVELVEEHDWVFLEHVEGSGGANRRGWNVEYHYNKYQCSRCNKVKDDDHEEIETG
jgi:hypothetical protein